jgi:hypothetical protein
MALIGRITSIAFIASTPRSYEITRVTQAVERPAVTHPVTASHLPANNSGRPQPPNSRTQFAEQTTAPAIESAPFLDDLATLV